MILAQATLSRDLPIRTANEVPHQGFSRTVASPTYAGSLAQSVFKQSAVSELDRYSGGNDHCEWIAEFFQDTR